MNWLRVLHGRNGVEPETGLRDVRDNATGILGPKIQVRQLFNRFSGSFPAFDRSHRIGRNPRLPRSGKRRWFLIRGVLMAFSLPLLDADAPGKF